MPESNVAMRKSEIRNGYIKGGKNLNCELFDIIRVHKNHSHSLGFSHGINKGYMIFLGGESPT